MFSCDREDECDLKVTHSYLSAGGGTRAIFCHTCKRRWTQVVFTAYEVDKRGKGAAAVNKRMQEQGAEAILDELRELERKNRGEK